INPTTHAIAEFPIPIPTASSGPGRITAGPDGNLWFTDFGQIGFITPATHAITEYQVPYTNSNPFDITAGPDGNLWFTDWGNGSIGVVILDQSATTHFAVTQQPPTSVAAGSPFGLTVEAENSS